MMYTQYPTGYLMVCGLRGSGVSGRGLTFGCRGALRLLYEQTAQLGVLGPVSGKVLCEEGWSHTRETHTHTAGTHTRKTHALSLATRVAIEDVKADRLTVPLKQL